MDSEGKKCKKDVYGFTHKEQRLFQELHLDLKSRERFNIKTKVTTTFRAASLLHERHETQSLLEHIMQPYSKTDLIYWLNNSLQLPFSLQTSTFWCIALALKSSVKLSS